jgi:hypothetical protein
LGKILIGVVLSSQKPTRRSSLAESLDADLCRESRLEESSIIAYHHTESELSLANNPKPQELAQMIHSGIVRNGIITLDTGLVLPEGTRVRIEVVGPTGTSPNQRVMFPLVPSENPGSVHVTNEMIAEILDDEDSNRGQLPGP